MYDDNDVVEYSRVTRWVNRINNEQEKLKVVKVVLVENAVWKCYNELTGRKKNRKLHWEQWNAHAIYFLLIYNLFTFKTKSCKKKPGCITFWIPPRTLNDSLSTIGLGIYICFKMMADNQYSCCCFHWKGTRQHYDVI